MRAAKRTLAMVCAIIATTFALTGTAFAATVHGADFSESGSTLSSGSIDALNIDGKAGETVWLNVTYKGRPIGKNIPYVIGKDAAAGDETTWAGIATLKIDTLDLSKLDGSYVINASVKREGQQGQELLYSGKLYGVYADLSDGTQKLIGTRTIGAGEEDRNFTAPTMVYDNGSTFKLVGSKNEKGVLHFQYEEYNEATTVDGVINYLDAEGNLVAKTDIPGISYGKEVTVDVPSVVVADNGDLYRTVFFKDTVTAKNPGGVSFSIRCTKITEADKALAGYYVATIKMVERLGHSKRFRRCDG